MKILVVIPAYNEASNIKNVVQDLKNSELLIDYLVINDCSTDNTLQVLEECNAAYLNLPLNLGIGGGVQSGYKYAVQNGYDIVIQVDGDGQHDTTYLKNIIEPIEKGKADIVIGSRFIDKIGFQSSGMRRLGIYFLSNLIYLCSKTKIYDATSGFRAVSGRFIELYAKEYPVDYPEPEAIVLASLYGAKILEVPVVMRERENGKSSITSWKSIYYMLKVSLSIVLCRLSNSRMR